MSLGWALNIFFSLQSLTSGDCPIEAGEEFVYNVEMKIEQIYPKVSTNILYHVC